MANDACLVNGRTYSYVDISVNLLGRTIEGISSISYDQTQEKQDNAGRGKWNVNRGYGNKQTTGSMTIDIEEWQAIINALPAGKDITDVSWFPIIVTFENEANQLIVHRLEKCEFKGQPIDSRVGDMRTEMTLELIIGKTNYKGI